MLAFIIPLKSQKASNSWELTSKLFERCIRSVCNQTLSNFRVIVVCNEIPKVEFTHPNITYIEVDFFPKELKPRAKDIDKGRRILTGVISAKKLNPSHIMVVDADDLISNRLAEFVNQNPQCNGWFVDRGYVYQEESKFVYLRASSFHRWCGTDSIIKYELYKFPGNNEKEALEFYDYYQNNEYYQHRDIVDNMIKNGTPLEPLPFAGVIYSIGNGDNTYQSSLDKLHNQNRGLLFRLKDFVNFRLITSAIQKEFNLYSIN